LQKLIYARDDKVYNEAYESLKAVASASFMEYFDKYYHHCPNAWSQRDKVISPNLGNDTTNRNENLNSKFKAVS